MKDPVLIWLKRKLAAAKFELPVNFELSCLSRQDWEFDYTDDSYKVYTCGNGHEHPECWRCMPYYGKISKRNLQRLHACKRREEVEQERWLNEQNDHRS